MRKNWNYIFMIFLLGSCLPNVYEKKQRNIVGDWRVSVETEIIRADTVFTTLYWDFELILNENGTGKYQVLTGDFLDANWYYQENPEQVLIVYGQSSPSSVFFNRVLYDVLENEQDHQLWRTENEAEENGETYRHTLSMTRN